MKVWMKNTILLVVLVLIIAIPLAFMGNNEFGGSDSAAADAVTEMNSDYEPWFESLWEPPSGEIESLLFCAQATFGAGIAGFALGRLTSKKGQGGKNVD